MPWRTHGMGNKRTSHFSQSGCHGNAIWRWNVVRARVSHTRARISSKARSCAPATRSSLDARQPPSVGTPPASSPGPPRADQLSPARARCPSWLAPRGRRCPSMNAPARVAPSLARHPRLPAPACPLLPTGVGLSTQCVFGPAARRRSGLTWVTARPWYSRRPSPDRVLGGCPWAGWRSTSYSLLPSLHDIEAPVKGLLL